MVWRVLNVTKEQAEVLELVKEALEIINLAEDDPRTHTVNFKLKQIVNILEGGSEYENR